MFRLIRVPRVLDKFFYTLQPYFHWNRFAYCRVLVFDTQERLHQALACRTPAAVYGAIREQPLPTDEREEVQGGPRTELMLPQQWS